MQRNTELYKRILKAAAGRKCDNNPKIDGFTDSEIGLQVYLMMKDGLIEAIASQYLENTHPVATLEQLTPKGENVLRMLEAES